MRVAPTKKLTPLFLDFETFWSVDFTLRKIPTGDYVRDPQFQIHCVAAKLGKGKTKLFTDMNKFQEYLDSLDADNIVLVGHNLYFDGLICTEIFDFVPAAYHCTMSMSRGLWRNTCAHGLDPMCKRLGLKGKVKAEALTVTKGRRTEELTKQELKNLGAYCVDDINDTAEAYWIMLPYMPDIEMEIISHTVRCFVEPLLIINAELLEEAIVEVEERRAELLDRIGNFVMAEFPDITDVGKALRSRKQFPAMLESLGIEVPLKVSPRTGKPTYALAMKDPEYMALCDDEDPIVRLLCECRNEFASNQTMTRAGRLLSATKGGGTLPIMYLYCGAHTMRWSASGKMNLQNLQRGSKLRKAIEAPPGYVLMVGDSGQIEARFTAWIAGQRDLVQAFVDYDRDPKRFKDAYCIFASDAFGRDITKEDELERFVGKTAILGLGFGMGWKKLLTTLFLAGVELPPHEVQRIHGLYRNQYANIVILWQRLESILAAMAAGGEGTIELAEGQLVLEYEADKVWMPNGLALHYPGLRARYDDEGRQTGFEFLYTKGQTTFWKSMWSGQFCENIVQCLARIAVAEQIVQIARRYRVVMTTHDEAVMLVKKDKASIATAKHFMIGAMSVPPEWAQTIPIATEVKYAANYSK